MTHDHCVITGIIAGAVGGGALGSSVMYLRLRLALAEARAEAWHWQVSFCEMRDAFRALRPAHAKADQKGSADV